MTLETPGAWGKNEEEGKERKTQRERERGKEREINKLIDFRA